MLAGWVGNFHGGNGVMPPFWLVHGCGSGDYLLLVMVGQKVWSGEGGGVREGGYRNARKWACQLLVTV